MKIAVILYTVRGDLVQDFSGTLEKIAEMGYKTVQIAGVPESVGAHELRSALDRLGLKAIAPHVGLDRLEGDLSGLVDEMHVLGCDQVVLPWISKDDYKDGWAAFADRCRPFADKLLESGIRFSYHNHSFEFEKEGDRTGHEIFFESAPASVFAEVDCFWVQHAGYDPATVLKRLQNRTLTTHWKDAAPKGKEPIYAEVGEGTMDWAPILDACRANHVEYAIVELDECPRPPLESIRIARQNMLAMGLKD